MKDKHAMKSQHLKDRKVTGTARNFKPAVALDILTELIVFQDLDMRIQWTNRAAQEWLGLKLNQIRGHYCYEAWHHRNETCPICPVRKTMETGNPEDVEYIAPDGKVWLIRSYPVRDKKNRLIGTFERSRDITNRKLARQALLESEVKYRTLVENATDLIFLIGEHGKILSVNKAAAHSLRKEPHEVEGKRVFDFFPAEIATRYSEHVKQVFETGEASQYENNMVAIGKESWITTSLNPVRDITGKVKAVLGVSRDITERKRTEELFITLSHALPVGILILQDRKIKFANLQFQRFSGYTEQELFDLKTPDSLIPEDEEIITKYRQQMSDEKSSLAMELKFTTKSGLINWALASFAPILYQNGQAVLVSVMDIGEQKRSNEMVRNLQKDLMERNLQLEIQKLKEEKARSEKMAIIGQMASIVAHEIRNPLGIINNVIYYLKIRPEMGDKKIQRHIASASKAISSASTIVEDLLDYSRPKTPVLKPVLLNSIIEEALSRIIINDNISIIGEFSHGMPYIKADPEMLYRVFINLIQNALQAIPEGGTLKLTTTTCEGWQEASIIDNGEGIPLETQEKLFQPLFSTRIKGVGLGLFIARQIITQHGGNIEVFSEPGQGATFTVRLPLEESKSNDI